MLIQRMQVNLASVVILLVLVRDSSAPKLQLPKVGTDVQQKRPDILEMSLIAIWNLASVWHLMSPKSLLQGRLFAAEAPHLALESLHAVVQRLQATVHCMNRKRKWADASSQRG